MVAHSVIIQKPTKLYTSHQGKLMIYELYLNKDIFKIIPPHIINYDCTAVFSFVSSFRLGWLRGPCGRWRWKLHSSHRRQFVPIWKRQALVVLSTCKLVAVGGVGSKHFGAQNDGAQTSFLVATASGFFGRLTRGPSESPSPCLC